MSRRTDHRPRRSGPRQLAEFLIVIWLGIVLARVYVVEAYVVPTGSMAPTLMGRHQSIDCRNCRTRFAVGADGESDYQHAICPNCGASRFTPEDVMETGGDRVLVQKSWFDLRPPRRWDVAVFWNPETPGEPFVKRVVGLPGEHVLIQNGDVVIDGRIARKSLARQRALRQLVYDHDHLPADYARRPRWLLRGGGESGGEGSRWRAEGAAFVRRDFEPAGAGSAAAFQDDSVVDWLEYQHWSPESLSRSPIYDFVAYNGARALGENRVNDLMLAAEVSLDSHCPALHVRIDNGPDVFEVVLPRGEARRTRVFRNGREQQVRTTGAVLHASDSPSNPAYQTVEVSTFDQCLLVAIDGRPAFAPLEYDERTERPAPGYNQLAWGIARGGATVRSLRVYRDVHYTATLSGSMRAAAVGKRPEPLGPGEYFVLGDNSPVSNDSRFWRNRPVVLERNLVGKPFVVHLPGESVKVDLFDRFGFWIPDFRRIRYIQ